VTHLDTTFLVDLLRERRRRRPAAAHAALAAAADEPMAMSVFVRCELEVGVLESVRHHEERSALDAIMTSIPVVYPDDRFGSRYAEALARIGRARTVATMDLLIGVTALIDGASLITRNRRHFEPIPGLTLIGY
jgi:predicted nucleic acid-binding protein